MSIESGWLTVAEASELTGVSERAIRRLLDAPANAARTRRETRHTATGTRQATVLAVELVEEIRRERGETPAGNTAQDRHNAAQDGAPSENGGTNAAPAVEEHGATVPEGGEKAAQDSGTHAERGETPANTGTNAAQTPDPTERLIVALETQIEELRRDKEAWRAQAEEANRNAAQATAALREYLRAQPRAITEGTATAPESPQAPAISPDGVALVEQRTAPQIAQKREAQPLWKVVLGIR